MNRIGHILGLVFATILLFASKTFLLLNPIVSAGFLLLVSMFYVVCTVVSKRSLFLYPVMFFGALAYYLCLYGAGISYIWYPAHSFVLIVLLAIAKYIAGSRGKREYSNAFRKGINTTVAFFTFWALSFARTYWGSDPMVYVLAFFCYAVFYRVQNRLDPERRNLTYVWIFYGIVGTLALAGMQIFPPLVKTALLVLLVFALAHRSIKVYKKGGYFATMPFLIGILVSTFFAFVFFSRQWNVLAITFLFSSLAFWYVYKAIKEEIVGDHISNAGEKFLMIVFKSGFILLPVVFWGILLSKGFPPGYLNITLSLVFALFFAKLTRSPYKSLFKKRNHYVYLSGMFFTALVYLVVFSFERFISREYLFLFTPVWMAVLLSIADFFRKNEDLKRANSIIDVAFLPIAINAILLMTLNVFNPTLGMILSGITIVTLFMFLAILRSHIVFYSFSLASWFALYSVLRSVSASTQVFVLSYMTVALACALSGYLLTRKKNVTSNVFNFSLVLYSLTAIQLVPVGSSLRLVVLCSMAIVYLLLGALLSLNKKTDGLFSKIGHFCAGMIIFSVLSDKSFNQAIYASFALAVAYLLPLLLHKREKYAYPASLFAALGYLLLLIKICPSNWVMFAYLPLIAVFLFHRKAPAARTSVYFSSVAIAFWALTSSALVPIFAAGSSILYGIVFILFDRKAVSFTATFASFLFLGVYFLLNSFFPTEQAIMFFCVVTFILFVGGVLSRNVERIKQWSSAFTIAGVAFLFLAAVISAFAGAITATKTVVVLSSVAFVLTALIFRKEIFLYLLTLNMALLFFNFVQTSGTVFTQDLFVYFVYGTLLIGAFFVIPYVKRLRRYDRVFTMFTIANWKGILVYSIPVCVILVITLMLYAVKITEHPQFCSSCHYMDDYVESWEHSNHKDVKCVDCHYEPGVKAIAIGKVEGLVQLVKYMTHTYGSKPWAEVRDKSCLREGCHDKMDRKKPVIFEKGIPFAHSTHLDNPAQKHTLRCTTCHGQSDDEA